MNSKSDGDISQVSQSNHKNGRNMSQIAQSHYKNDSQGNRPERYSPPKYNQSTDTAPDDKCRMILYGVPIVTVFMGIVFLFVWLTNLIIKEPYNSH